MSIFGAKDADKPAVEVGGLSIIAVGLTVRGDLESNGTVKVEGTVEGHVQARDQVLVAKGGVVQGDIDAREAIVGGAVHGAVRTVERVEVQAGAVVNGDIVTRRIAVAEGGSLNGQIRMEEGSGEARPADARNGKAEGAKSVPAATPPVRPSVPVARVAVPPRLPSTGIQPDANK